MTKVIDELIFYAALLLFFKLEIAFSMVVPLPKLLLSLTSTAVNN